MPEQNQDPQGGAGGTSAPAASGAPASEGQPPADQGKQPPAQQYVTPTALQAVLDRQKHGVNQEFTKLRQEITSALGDSLSERIAKILEAHAEKERAPKDKTKEDPHAQEIAKLRSDLDSARKEGTELRTNLERSQQKEKEFRVRSRTIETLRKYECVRPDLVYLGLQSSLHLSEDGESVFAIVKDQFGGEEQVALDDFVKTKVRDELYPEVFKGNTRAGAQAGGDNGGAGARWKFTKEQVDDLEFYQKHREEIDKALRAGQVKGYDTPVSGVRR